MGRAFLNISRGIIDILPNVDFEQINAKILSLDAIVCPHTFFYKHMQTMFLPFFFHMSLYL